MEIKETHSLRFGSEIKGIILDNAYDTYCKNRYIDYMQKDEITYLLCQDVDMSLLKDFKKTEYLTVPEEAENLGALCDLDKIKGLELTAACLAQIDLNWFPLLEILVVHGQPVKKITCDKIRKIYCCQWAMKELTDFISAKNLKSLHLEYCTKLESLNGLKCLQNLETLEIDYCLNLKNLIALEEIAESLKELSITDCNKINEYHAFSKLKKLEILYLTRFQTNKTGTIDSIKFIDLLPNLQRFMTDYRIEDKDLTPLLKLKEATILRFYKDYNVQENALPHIEKQR